MQNADPLFCFFAAFDVNCEKFLDFMLRYMYNVVVYQKNTSSAENTLESEEEIMKKIITLFLAIILVVSMFAACTTPGGSTDGSKPAGGGDATPAPSGNGGNDGGEEQPETNELEAIGLPENINLGGKEISVYRWTNLSQAEFDVSDEQLDGDPIADSVYKRNLYTEQLLNIEFEFYDWGYYDNGLGQMIQACDELKNAMSDASTSVDIIANYSRVVPTGAIRGLCSDLTALDNLDISKEWWPQNLKNEIAIFDNIMFLSGDVSTSLILMTYALFYNKTLAEAYGIDNIIQLVDDGDWTIDKLIEVTKVGYEDIDDVSGKSIGDQFAITFDYWNADAIVQGCGFKLLENTADGIRLATAFPTATFGDFLGKLGKWSATDNVFNDASYTGGASAAFVDGRSLFMISAFNLGFTLQQTDVDYGIIPMPKLNESQENYITTAANSYSMYSISRQSKHPEDAAAALQTLGYYGLQYTTPAVFEVTLQGKFSKDEDTMRLLNTIKSGVQFDLGLLFPRQVDGICDLPTMAIKNNEEWSVKINNRKLQMLNKMVEALNEDIRENLGL